MAQFSTHLATAIFALCLTLYFAPVTSSHCRSGIAQQMDTPGRVSQSLHQLNKALAQFDSRLASSAKSIQSLAKGLAIFSRTAPRHVPVDAALSALTAEERAVDDLHRSTDVLVRWSASGTAAINRLLSEQSAPMTDDQFYASVESVVTGGRTAFDDAATSLRTAVSQLKALRSHLGQIRPDARQPPDFAELVSFLLRSTREHTTAADDMEAALRTIADVHDSIIIVKDGVFNSFVMDASGDMRCVDAATCVKIIRAYLSVFEKGVDGAIESLSQLKLDLSPPPEEYCEADPEPDHPKPEDPPRDSVLEALRQLGQTMQLVESHALPGV